MWLPYYTAQIQKGEKEGGALQWGSLGEIGAVESGGNRGSGRRVVKQEGIKTKRALYVCWGIFGTVAGAMLVRYV